MIDRLTEMVCNAVDEAIEQYLKENENGRNKRKAEGFVFRR